MWTSKGAALALFVAVGCGHATTTGSAQNDWTTPTGYASATNPRIVDPNGGQQPARDRSLFARREAPTLQPQPSDALSPSDTRSPLDTLSPAPMPPPDELLPPAYDGRMRPRSFDEVPPYVMPEP